jgi:hypothetical protein
LTVLPAAFFAHLTTKQIRNNAMIEDGLARAVNDTDARRWLTCFGSAQREDGELEAQEVQSILFTGFGRQQYATSLFIKLPSDPDGLRTWLQAVSGIAFSASPGLIGLPPHWKIHDQRLGPTVIRPEPPAYGRPAVRTAQGRPH